MSIVALGTAGAQSRIASVNAAAGEQPVVNGQQVATPSVLKSLSDFVPTEIVAIFIPGIFIVVDNVKYTGPLLAGCDHWPCNNVQSFWAWTWYCGCCLLTVVFYYTTFIYSWQQRKSTRVRLVDLITGIAPWQAVFALCAFMAWGLSISPSGVLMWPGPKEGVDPHPYASLLVLILSPLFAAFNQILTYKAPAS